MNGYEVATMGNASVENTWPTCVGCAILQRSMERTNTKIPDACAACFKQFCWDGTVNSTQPAPYEPTFKNNQLDTGSGKSAAFVGKERNMAALTLGVFGAILMTAM